MIQRVSGREPLVYLRTFADLGYQIHIIDKAVPGKLVPVSDPESLLATWPSEIHIEDILLLPA
jgi:hypothetical protein